MNYPIPKTEIPIQVPTGSLSTKGVFIHLNSELFQVVTGGYPRVVDRGSSIHL